MVSGVFSIPLELNRSGGNQQDRKNGSTWMLREFVSGDENALVRVVAEALRQGRPLYNPIVFYGPAGTGKSLLAQGLAGNWKKANPRSRMIAMSGADLARHFANAVDTDAVSEFRGRLQQAALLVVDGIEQLSGHEAAQRELVLALDQLTERQQRVLATASQLPTEISGLLPGLASRLSAGLTVPLSAPGPLARQRIVERLAAVRHLQLSPQVVQLLACGSPAVPHFLNTVPQLDQALSRLSETATLAGVPIDEQLADNYLREESPSRHATLKSIATQVALHFQVKTADLRGATRRQQIVRARGIAMYLARTLTDNSLQQVGKYFGDRDHSTVLHACRKTESLLDSDPAIRETVNILAEQICSP